MTLQTLPARPLLKPWYRVSRQQGRIVLEYGDSLVALEGGATREFLPALLPLLDGHRSVEEIVGLLGDAVAPAVERVLGELMERGVLTEGPPLDTTAPEADTCAFLSAFSGDRPSSAIAEALESTRTAIVGDGPQADEISRQLRLSGLQEPLRLAAERVAAEATDLVIAAPGPSLHPLLERVNEAALRTSSPWLQVLPFDGRHSVVGPLFVPGETCCHRCYVLRRASTSGYAEEYEQLYETPADRPSPFCLGAIVAGLAALVAVRWLTLRDPALPGVMLSLELLPAATLTSHVVYRVPRCPACGVAGADPMPWFEVAAE
jgi:bacteriocin biosynthesis cyclodehydratase domain-containing protein